MPANHDIAIAVAVDQSQCIKIRFGCFWIELLQGNQEPSAERVAYLG